MIIGLDFGNKRSYTSFVRGMDNTTRLGGMSLDLLPNDQAAGGGIPSIYYYSKAQGERVGSNATSTSCRPLANRIDMLKMHMGQSFTLDGKTISYDHAIQKVIEHCVRVAQKELAIQYQEDPTYKVSLAYPVRYNDPERRHLKELVEQIVIDGHHLEVTGMITEPAAAALDYFAQHGGAQKENTVLAYDLGGGTFDLSVVSVYPNGRKRNNGDTYYYDVVCENGAEIGGADFDERLRALFLKQLGETPQGRHADIFPTAVEKAKIELSKETATELTWCNNNGDYVDIRITREEFEAATKDLVDKTIVLTQKMISQHPEVQWIMLTGGASQMPIIRCALERALPEYKKKIVFHNPSRAVSYGAARYGTNERNVQRRTIWDLGIRYLSEEDRRRYIEILIPAGTPIPFSTNNDACTSGRTKSCLTSVYEATKEKPDAYAIDTDFRMVTETELFFKAEVSKGTAVVDQLNIDKDGILTVRSFDPSDPDNIRSENQVIYMKP